MAHARLHWSWNGRQPDWLDSGSRCALSYDPIADRVEIVTVNTNLTVGAIQYVLGRPDAVQFLAYPVDHGAGWAYRASYTQAHLTIGIEAPCPAGAVMRQGGVTITFGAGLPDPDPRWNARTVCP